MILEPLKLIIDGEALTESEMLACAPTIHITLPPDDMITATLSDDRGVYSDKVYLVISMVAKRTGTYIILETPDDQIQ